MFTHVSASHHRLPTCESLEPRLLLSTVSVTGTVFDDADLDAGRDGGEPGVAGIVVYADQDGNGLLNAMTFTEASGAASIPDGDISMFPLGIIGGTAPVADVNVQLDITHADVADLDIVLISPAGTRVTLVTGLSGSDISGAVLDDQAAGDIASAAAPFTGTFRPVGQLGDLNGQSADGSWWLEITDAVMGHSGSLNAWALELTVGDVTTTTDGAGAYELAGLPPVAMDIAVAGGAQWVATTPPVTITGAADVTGADIGIAGDGSVGGTVFTDTNGDGIHNDGAPVAGQLVYVDADADGLLDTNTENVGDSADVAIADRSFAVTEIPVADLAGLIRHVAVTVDINHLNVGDLSAWLVSPAGTQVELFANVGGDGDNFSFTVFDDDGLLPIEAGTAPFAGKHRPAGNLADVIGEDPNGMWRLLVADDVPNGVTGVVDSWSMALDIGDPRMLSDPTGAHQSPSLPPGSYTIRTERQDGWLLTAPVGGAYDVALASGTLATDIDFARGQAGLIAGALWHDVDADAMLDVGETPLEGWQVFVDIDDNGAALSAEQTFSNLTAAPVPDRGTMTSPLLVSGAAGVILDVDVRVSIDHTYVSDLDVFLISPAGTRIELFTDIGGSGQDLTDVRLDDEATQNLADASSGDAPFTGSWRGESLLAGFDGELAAGTWFLEVSDDAGSDTGSLLNWDLILTTGDPVATTDAAGQYGFGRIVPGQWPVRVEAPAGWGASTPPSGVYVAAVTSGGVVSDADFGLLFIGDMNGDLEITSADIDALDAAVDAGATDPLYDINDDGQVTAGDIDALVEDVVGTHYGDADVDGDVDLDDFVALKQNFATGSTWGEGDFTLDGVVNLDDFVILKQNFGSAAAPEAAASVPAEQVAAASAPQRGRRRAFRQTPASAPAESLVDILSLSPFVRFLM